MSIEEELRSELYKGLKNLNKEELGTIAREGLKWYNSSLSEYYLNAVGVDDLEKFGSWLIGNGFKLYLRDSEVDAKSFAQKISGGSLIVGSIEYVGGISSNVFGYSSGIMKSSEGLRGKKLPLERFTCNCIESMEGVMKPVKVLFDNYYVAWKRDRLSSYIDDVIYNAVKVLPMEFESLRADGSILLFPDVLKEFMFDDICGGSDDYRVEIPLSEMMKFTPNLFEYGSWLRGAYPVERSFSEAVDTLANPGCIKRMSMNEGNVVIETLVEYFNKVSKSTVMSDYGVARTIINGVYDMIGLDIQE